jgi:hypothetical protein
MTLKDTLAGAAKDLPQVAGSGLVLWGLSLDKWIVIATALWATFRLFDAGLSLYWKWKDRREQERKEQERK